MAKRKSKIQPVDSSLKLFDNVPQINPLSDTQTQFVENLFSNKHQLLLGHPGTGKTYLALHAALLALKEEPDKYSKIIIVRSPVQTTDIGHTPGTVEEKASVYEGPYPSMVNKICKRGDAYEILKKKGMLSFELSAFLRGDTFNNAIVIVDELQNFTSHSADTVLTRTGKNTRLFLCGDLQQRDLTKASEKDIEKFLNVIEHIPNMFDFLEFGVEDIVRSGLIAAYIKSKFKLYSGGY